MSLNHESDPADFTVVEVAEYLEGVLDPAEVGRVLGLEREGKARRSLLEAGYPDLSAAVQPKVVTNHGDDAVLMGYTLVDVTDAAVNPPATEV